MFSIIDFHHPASPTQDVKMNPPPVQESGSLSTQGVFGMKEQGAQRVSKAGAGAGDASEHPLLVFPSSSETVPRIRGAGVTLGPVASHLQAHCSQTLIVVTQSGSSGYRFEKQRKKTSMECWGHRSCCTLTRLLTVSILAFVFKRPNLLRTLLKEQVTSFQIKDEPVCVCVTFILISGRLLWIQGAISRHATTHECGQPTPLTSIFCCLLPQKPTRTLPRPHPLLYLFID